MRNKFVPLLGAACLFVARLANAQANFAVIGATLEADPKVYEGPCPTVIKFHGSIETNGPGTVKYIFERSDGALDTTVKSVAFAGPPFHLNIPDTTWTLGGPGFSYSGWERIKILSPNAGFLSNKAEFRVKCTPGTPPGTQPGTGENPNGRPDLTVTTFGFKGPIEGQGQCRPHTAVYIFEVTVKNQGTASSPSSASLGNKALVQAMAQDKAGWGNGVFLNALPPGGSQTVDIPVYYLMSDPAFMVNNAPHPFMAIADPLGLVNELDESNNKKGPINMGAPANCPRPQPNP